VLGVALYNWWAAVAVGVLGHGALSRNPNSLFSDLEATGQPDAGLLRSLDVAAGTLILVAFVLLGRPHGRRAREWVLLVVFSVAVVVGGLFPYACTEGINASCRAAEWHFRLPWQHYVHVGAGIVEFGSVTAAAWLARSRTRGQPVAAAGVVGGVCVVLAVAYPVLGVSYLADRLGVFVEPLFFVSFSTMVVVELFAREPATQTVAGRGQPSRDPPSGVEPGPR